MQLKTIFGHLMMVAAKFGLNISNELLERRESWRGPACSKKHRQDTSRQKQHVPNDLAKAPGIEPVAVIC